MASKFLLILALLSIAELSFIATVVSRDVPSGATSKAILQTGISKANSTNGSSTGISRNINETKLVFPPSASPFVRDTGESIAKGMKGAVRDARKSIANGMKGAIQGVGKYFGCGAPTVRSVHPPVIRNAPYPVTPRGARLTPYRPPGSIP